MRWIPFTAHIKVVPEAPGNRFEYIRSLQKWAYLLAQELSDSPYLNLADGGGGQHYNIGNGGNIGNSALVKGLAVKPQIGETPAQFMITGFYDNASATNQEAHPSVTRISGGETYQGNVAAAAENNPNSWVDSGVSDIKAIVDSAISASLPASLQAKLFRLEYAGVVYGDRGYHFPLTVG
jgi:hypothetical protein